MNNRFNISRFYNYCMKQVYEGKRSIALQFFSIAGIYTILLVLFRNTADDTEVPFISTGFSQMIIWLSFFVYLAKNSSLIADSLSTRSKLVLYLSVPASTAEKYIAHLLSSAILYPLVFFAGIIVAQYASEFLATFIWGTEFTPGTPLEGCLDSWEFKGDFGKWTVALIILQALDFIVVFTLGATIWKKNCFIKTVAVLMLASVLSIILLAVFINVNDVVLLTTYLSSLDYSSISVDSIMAVFMLSGAIITLLFGLIGYLRVKELEINETKK